MDDEEFEIDESKKCFDDDDTFENENCSLEDLLELYMQTGDD